MARNVEIKARVASLDGLEPRVAAIAQEGPIAIPQDDTFFRCDAGRLKLRTFADGHGELIFYRRADRAGPRESSYVLSRIDEPASLAAALAPAYGISGRVRKQRTLYLVGQTRVHLDRVERLGPFVELEVVLDDTQTVEQGAEIASALMVTLGIRQDQLVEGAYLDLLLAAP